MPITNLPTPPTRSDPVNFNSRADAFLAALPAFATEANALQTDINAKQTAAATSAANALASENAAAANSGATIWVSGTTYAIGNVRFSPVNFLSYRRKTAGAGTTDPSADNTNWQLINGTGNVDLTSTQTLTNKTFSTGSVWNGSIVAIAHGGTAAGTAVDAFINLRQPASETVSGVVELATVSEASAGTDTTRVITPSGLRSAFNATGSAPVYACRAWVNFNGTGTVAIRASGNVSSITDNGTGDYTINFATAMPDANYAVFGLVNTPGLTNPSHVLGVRSSGSVASPSLKSTSQVQVITGSAGSGTVVDMSEVYVSVFR